MIPAGKKAMEIIKKRDAEKGVPASWREAEPVHQWWPRPKPDEKR